MQPPPRLSDTPQCLCLASRKAARAITRAFDKELRLHGIRATQFSVLACLTGRGPQTIGELAETLGTDRTTLTRNLALLEKGGLIQIRPGDDARSRIVSITERGRGTLTDALPSWHKVQSALTEEMGEEMAESLRQVARTTRF